MFWDQGKMNLPSDRSIVLSFASKASAQFDACPEPLLPINITDISQYALETQRFDPDIIAYFKRAGLLGGHV